VKPTIFNLFLLLLALMTAVVLSIWALDRWGLQGSAWEACAVDAPMEQAHCRALRGDAKP